MTCKSGFSTMWNVTQKQWHLKLFIKWSNVSEEKCEMHLWIYNVKSYFEFKMWNKTLIHQVGQTLLSGSFNVYTEQVILFDCFDFDECLKWNKLNAKIIKTCLSAQSNNSDKCFIR